MKIKKGDTVRVITGRDKGVEGVVTGVDPKRHGAITRDGVDLFIQEEQSGDAETFHAVEEISVLVAE